jgi:hypothetical protein
MTPLAALPIVKLQAIDELQSSCGVSQAISFHVAVQTAAEWTSDMSVCYWTEFCTSRHDTQSEASSTPANCVSEAFGTFGLDLSNCSSVQVHAAVVHRDSDSDTLMSEVAKLMLSPYGTSSELLLCTGDAHVQGAWVPFEPSAKSFVCCSWEKDDYINLPEQCGTPTVRTGLIATRGDGASAEPPYYTHVGGHACYCDAEQGRFTINRREKYRWKSDHCRLPSWDANSFCVKLGRRNIIFIGDSTMQQTAATVINMLVAGQGSCAPQLLYGLSDTLVYRNHGGQNRGTHWLNIVGAAPDNSIIVISAGPHVHKGFDSLLAEVAAAIKSLRKERPSLTFVWKTQQPAHNDCHNITEPLVTTIQQVIFDISTRVFASTTNSASSSFAPYQLHDTLLGTLQGKSQYNHGDFRSFDATASRVFTSELQQPVLHLEPLYYRADAHPVRGNDCLHYCIPGPLDIAAVLLHHMLVSGEL